MRTELKILVVDELNEFSSSHLHKLRAQPGAIDLAQNIAKAWEFFQLKDYDIICGDCSSSAEICLDFLQKIKRRRPDVPVMIRKTPAIIADYLQGKKSGGMEFGEGKNIHEFLNNVFAKARTYHASRYYRIQHKNLPIKEVPIFDKMVGRSSKLRSIFTTISDVAKTGANIFISGESGTGKELVARSIHKQSLRGGQPFVPVNFSALPNELFESELFGYEKGAFTSAVNQKIGLLEFAHHGTFFMDEICQLPIFVQPKLLRALQDKNIRRIGGSKLIETDIRLISASNIEPDRALETNLLRRDFYYRINVINLHIPPLRERQEDIRPLAYYFLDQNLKLTTKEIHGFDEDVLLCFESYPWLGNARELENVVERAVALTHGDVISMQDIPDKINLPLQNQSGAKSRISLAEAKKQAIDKVEQEYLQRMLAEYQGNVTSIARESGMTRRNLHRLLKRHKLNPAIWRQ